MIKLNFVVASLALISCLQIVSAQEKLSLKDVRSRDFRAKSAPAFRSMADGKHYTALVDGGRAIVKYQYSNGQPVDTLLNLDKVKAEEDIDIKSLRLVNYELSEDEQRLLVYSNPEYIYRRSFKADYYYFVVGRQNFKRISKDKVMAATLAPDGRQVAFAKDNNLYISKVMDASINLVERQITNDGKWNEIINGIPDWVYEEEFSMYKAFTWSVDSKYLCYIKFDESKVKEYALPMYKGRAPEYEEYATYPGNYSYKYPVSGEVNSTVSVWSYNVTTRKTQEINVPLEAEGYIPRVRATKDPMKIAVMTFNRHQSDFKMYFADPASGIAKMVIEDKNDQYVGEGNMDDIQFYPDGFTFVSEKSGYRHLYYYNMSGMLQRQITKGDFDLTRIYGYDSKTKTAYVQAAYLGKDADMPSAITRGIYKIDAKGNMVPLFNGGKDGKGCRGTHSASFSKGFVYMQHFYSDAETPTKVTLELVNGLKLVKVMEDNHELSERLAKRGYSHREFFQFTTPDGVVLNGYLTKPYNFDPNKKYPVLMEQYSGPGSQQVADSWKFSWEQFLNAEDFVVACVDGRGTGYRGAAFERQTYCHLGILESQDQLFAGQYIASLPYTDPSRMAIWGWSFGGYNTLMTMCHDNNNVYKCGVAVAPVTDWRYYDSVYTERYMRTPQENEEGYRSSSVLTRAKNLKGNLLICHGSADDNVHPQNTFELTEEFVQNDVEFDMHIYTNRNHSISGGNTSNYIYTQVYRYIKNHLK